MNLLPIIEDELNSTPTPRQTLRICLNLKNLVDELIKIPIESSDTIAQLLDKNVIKLALEACGGDYRNSRSKSCKKYQACIIFCLLIVHKWYCRLSDLHLNNSKLFDTRAYVCEYLSKLIIDHFLRFNDEDDHYLFIEVLCKRYQILLNDEVSNPISALELAVDNHSTVIISSTGYQKCISHLWNGWIIQSDKNPMNYVIYKDIANSNFSKHFNPDRLKTPKYQNFIEIIISVFYLLLYTNMLNDSNRSIDLLEFIYYFMTFSFALDEFIKFYNIGLGYFNFWSVFNDSMYLIILASLSLRIIANYSQNSHFKLIYLEISYKFLSCVAPMMWCRLLLYLDSEKFVGAMIVVISKMMKESILFFALLFIINIGFLQGFIGLDSADGKLDKSKILFKSMIKTIIGNIDFDLFEQLAPPYSGILYYFFVFIIMVILMNILGALFNSSYSLIVDKCNEEYLALKASKTLRYIRSPDLDLFIPPLNLFELVFLTIPLSWWLNKVSFKQLNRLILTICYSPILLITAVIEVRISRRVQYNRMKGASDDANQDNYEWDLTDGFNINVGTTNETIQENLKLQSLAETQDPEFMIDLQKFGKKIEKIVAYQQGILENVDQEIENDSSEDNASQKQTAMYSEENFDKLNARIDELTKLVHLLLEKKQD